MMQMNMIPPITFNKSEIQPSKDVGVVADTLSEMVVTQFFNTMLDSLDQDLNKEMYNYFLAEGIASNDGKSGLREHFKIAFLRQLQTDSKRSTEVDGYAISTYTKMQEITGGKDA